MMQTMQMRPLRVTDIIDFAGENHRDVTVVSRIGATTVSHGYRDIRDRALRLSAALRGLGIGKGDAVASLAWNDHRHLELYYGVPGAGAVIHTINPRLPVEQIRYMLEAADDRILFYDPDFAALVDAAVAGLADPPRLVMLGDAYEALLADAAGPFVWTDGDEAEPCGLCFTSGTTGSPKGVAYTHRSTVLHAMGCCMSEGQAISTREKVLPVVPMFHANAWGVPHSAPMAGAPLVLPGRNLDGNSLLDLVRDEGVTFLCGVPTIWQAILDAADKRGCDLTPLTRAGIGGAPPSRPLIERIEALGVAVFHAWGMTETNPFGGTGFLSAAQRALPPEEQMTLKMGQGRPIFGLERRIVDDAGQPLARDGETPGRLVVRGNWVIERYTNVAESPLDDGWFDTGDIATIAPDGHMTLVDRAKDLIKSGGEWISSVALEGAAEELPQVAACAAIACPDTKWGERPMLFVVTRAGMAVTADAIRDHLATRFARWQLPEDIRFVDALPLTAVGKIDKKVLRASLG
jgi:acyl-CoA synthetase (AMP-forming)/AMP-acid ligase II